MTEETFEHSPEEVAAILDEVSEPEEIRILKTSEEREIAARIIPILAGKANAAAEVHMGKKLQATVDELKTQNTKLIEAELQKIRNASKPPDLEEIQKLLNQEYMEVQFQVHERGKTEKRTFSIRELPQAAEDRFLSILQKSLIPRMKEFASIEWTNTATVSEKIQRVMEVIPDGLDMMSDLAAVALDPFKEDAGVSKDWVKNNLSSYRVMMVIQAQIEAGKFRDFFLAVYRAIPSQAIA